MSSSAELVKRMQDEAKSREQIPRWRFDAMRSASVDALRLASQLLAHQEGICTMNKDDFYHALVELNKTLASGVYQGTQP